ncbi:MAG: nucleotidyl transferase AbiEii/AbiGii toxin family protein [Proteobacteria bacterium]|nr:nucleotidyl transferase AbiEii/AbiGii toxin family protein [Pseudomonadota bacterium]
MTRLNKDKPSNVTASVRHRLLDIIRETGDDANLVWTRYAAERFLYRLCVSEYAEDFVLKGAMLFMAWTGRSHRPTVDIDFLGHGENSDKRLVQIFRAVCGVEVEDDGLIFDPDTIKVAPIREGQEYQGQRVMLTAFLGKARIPLQVDVGFGDVVTPEPRIIIYPTLLDFPAPRIRSYPHETVIAEKLQTVVVRGIANSRMKDFYDLYVLARDFAFDGETLTRAIGATFSRRRTEIPQEPPLALTEEFARDDVKSVQWTAFVRKSGIEQDVPQLLEVLSHLRQFLFPLLRATSGQAYVPKYWSPGGPWVFAESVPNIP